MAKLNGKDQGSVNVDKFISWSEVISNEDVIQFCRGGNLNKTAISRELGIAKSTFGSNGDLLTSLENFETSLRAKGILPELADSPVGDGDKDNTLKYDQTYKKNILNTKRLTQLEQENIALKAKNDDLERQLARAAQVIAKSAKYEEQNKVMEEFNGRFPL